MVLFLIKELNIKRQKNMKTRMCISFDEINFFWVVWDNTSKKLIKNPTKDELSGIKLRYYNKTNICQICREEDDITDKSILYPENACRGIDKDGNNIDDEWICVRHRNRNYQRYYPNSEHNIIKQLRDCRIGNSKDPRKILGYNCEDLTEKWLGAERLAVKYDKYSRLDLDHEPITKHISIKIGDESIDLYGKVPHTKGVSYNQKTGMWNRNIQGEHGKKFDILVIYCISEDGKTIERVYIFPVEDILDVSAIGICKDPKDGYWNPISTWYERYNITDIELIKKINEIWKEIITNEHGERK